MEDLEPRDIDEGEALEAEILRADRPFGSELPGITAEEAEQGESLEEHLAEERPDRAPVEDAVAVLDEGPLDDEDELVGDVAIEHDHFAAPEEAAVTIRDDAPGATDHADPHHERDE